MNKLIVTLASIAAITMSGYSSVCSDSDAPVCRAWDVSMNLKTLAPKKTTCSVESCTPCGESSSETVYYMTGTTRKLKGYLWICDYECDDDPMYNCVIWDEKNKCSVIAYSSDNIQQVSGMYIYAYDKKADKVTATIEFSGTDALGEESIQVVASGIGGKLDRPKNGDDCYLKSISGHATGLLKYVKPGYTVKGRSAGGLCADPDPVLEFEDVAKLVPMCSACCFDGWCDSEDAPDLVPCSGTWKIKYNKKVSNGNKPISSLIPGYAL